MNGFGNLALSSVLLLPALAIAGPSTGSVSASLIIPGISQALGQAEVKLDSFLSIDAVTGAVVVNQAQGTVVTRALGVFTFEAAGADAPLLFDRTTGKYQQATGTTIRWDSYARVDGSFNNTAPVGETSASSFSFVVAANVDPFMTYGLSVRNSTNSTNNYTFTFTESLVPPVNGLYDVYADISGSLVNGVAGSALNLGTTVGGTIQKVFLKDSAYVGADSAGVDVGLASLNAAALAGSTTYSGNGLQSATASGTSGVYTYDSWEFRTDFSLSGGKDVATLSGYAEISPIPEPQTYALFAAGLLSMLLMLRRRSHD
jgi:hypothetical protein